MCHKWSTDYSVEDNSRSFDYKESQKYHGSRRREGLKVYYLRAIVPTMVIIFASYLSVSFYVIPAHASEPSLTDILNNLGYTNVAESTVETFPKGTYNIARALRVFWILSCIAHALKIRMLDARVNIMYNGDSAQFSVS